MAEEGGLEVLLHVYDLSNGLAQQLSLPLLGKQINGVWHTAIVYCGTEYYYGGGIQQGKAGQTPFGTPVEVISLGKTHVPFDVFQEYLVELSSVYTAEAYSLFDHNCNNFSDDVANFLTGSGIPSHITALPREVLATPFGQMIAPSLRNVQGTLGCVQQPQQMPRPAAPTPFTVPHQDVTASVAESLRAATAAVVADTGIPLDAETQRGLLPKQPATQPVKREQKDEGIKRLAETNVALSENRVAAAEVASSLSRTSMTSSGGSATSLPKVAPSRRLTTTSSGEIITRLGSGQLANSPIPGSIFAGGRPHTPPMKSQSVMRAALKSKPEPAEPRDGTKAQSGPSSAKIAGVNAEVARTIERSNSGRDLRAKAAFEAAVRREFAKIMAEGGLSPNEAAALAIKAAAQKV